MHNLDRELRVSRLRKVLICKHLEKSVVNQSILFCMIGTLHQGHYWALSLNLLSSHPKTFFSLMLNLTKNIFSFLIFKSLRKSVRTQCFKPKKKKQTLCVCSGSMSDITHMESVFFSCCQDDSDIISMMIDDSDMISD